MAAVTDLQVDRERLCPGEKATVVATTIASPDENDIVTWKINGQVVPGLPQAPNTLEVFHFPPGIKVITASLDGSSLSVTVIGLEADVEIELEPDPADGRYVITAEPRMQPSVVTARAVGIGGPISVLEWSVTVGIGDFHDCPPNGPRDLDTTVDLSPTGGGEQITINLENVIRGGGIFFSVRGTVNGCELLRFGSGGIDGTNPQQSDIQAALPHDALRRIACKESGQRQFDAPPNGGTGFCPLFGTGGKVGIMQIPDPTADEVWNWRLNVEKGIEIFNERVAAAGEYPSRVRNSEGFRNLVAQFNQRRQQQGLDPVQVVLPDFTKGNFDDDPQQLELDAIRGYNGWEGSDRFGFEMHEFRVAVDVVDGGEVLRVTNINEQTLKGMAVWERVPSEDRPQGLGEPNYVNNVLALTPACLFGPFTILTGPTPVMRLDVANYAVMNVSAGAIFSNWTFDGGGVRWSRPGNNNVSNWQGNMVQSGRVSVKITVGGMTTTLTHDVVVTPRPWTENAPTIPLGRAGNGTLRAQLRVEADLGITNTNGEIDISTGVVNSGPNEGFQFVARRPVTWTVQANSNDALYDSTHPFFRAHARNPLPSGRVSLTNLRSDVEAHEGIVRPPPSAPANFASHWQAGLNHLAVPANRINAPREGDVVHVNNETRDNYKARVIAVVEAGVNATSAATAPHPPRISVGTIYFNYPFILPRRAALRVGGPAAALTLANPAGGTVWKIDAPIATLTVQNASQATLTPNAAGTTTVRVTNADGDIDEIRVEITTMIDRSSIERAVTDRGLDLQTRIGALQRLFDAGTNSEVLALISTQIDGELAGDTRFVIYLLGAVRRIFDRRAIDVFVGLLARPIDLSFRSQSLIGLCELYRYSVRRWLLARPRAAVARPAFTQHLSEIDENFVVHGSDLTSDDRRRIEQELLAVAENEREIAVLRDEARQCYTACHSLGTLMQSENGVVRERE